jgi:hypothetical protein
VLRLTMQLVTDFLAEPAQKPTATISTCITFGAEWLSIPMRCASKAAWWMFDREIPFDTTGWPSQSSR